MVLLRPLLVGGTIYDFLCDLQDDVPTAFLSDFYIVPSVYGFVNHFLCVRR